MKITKAIERLKSELAIYGDIDVYAGEGRLLQPGDIKVSSACALFDTDKLDIDDSDIVVYIDTPQ